jgi:hypothetical protein
MQRTGRATRDTIRIALIGYGETAMHFVVQYRSLYLLKEVKPDTPCDPTYQSFASSAKSVPDIYVTRSLRMEHSDCLHAFQRV